MKKLVLVAIVAFLAFPLITKAQDYDRALGIRFGQPFGITYKQALGNDNAIEVIAAARFLVYSGFLVTALYEKHFYPFNIDGLGLFIGAGAHAGFYNYSTQENFNLGPDAIFGLDFTFRDAPINLSLDLKPTYNIFSPNDLRLDEGALSIRYVF